MERECAAGVSQNAGWKPADARAAPIRCAAAALARELLPLAGGRMRCPLAAAAAMNTNHASYSPSRLRACL